MSPNKIFELLILSVWCIHLGNGAKILFISPIGSISHKNFFMGIAEALAEGGHEITMVSTYKDEHKKENIREVVLEADSVVDAIMSRIFEDEVRRGIHMRLFFTSQQLCMQSLKDKAIQDLRDEKFDLIFLSMFFDSCFLSLVHHFKVPFIFMYTGGLFGHYTDMAGELQMSSLYKNELVDEGNFPFPFLSRLKTTIFDVSMSLVNIFHTYRTCDRMCREDDLCPPDMPSLKEISDNASLVMINNVKILEFPTRPSMPHVIHLGGIHCRPSKPLPKDLENWASSAEHGFILFSLGSSINKPSVMPERFRKSILKVFGSLKYKVLFKWDQEDMQDLPPNVKLIKWLPQQDVLGHPNIKLFITHGGLLSRQEAIYHGVPAIGMPVFGDQYFNTQESIHEGWGDIMIWEDLEEEDIFRNTIEKVIGNQSFRDSVKSRSKLMKDRPMSQSQEALYWTEYVLRHEGAPHLRSSLLKLNSFQLYNIDVLIFIGFFIVILCILMTWLTYLMIRICFAIKQNKHKKD